MTSINTSVNGTTQVYGVIGCPVSHSFSPVIHNTIKNITGRDFIYTAMEVRPEKLREAIIGAHGLGIKGLNVTVPHKVAVMEELCRTDKNAEVIKAVNTLKYTDKGYEGYNTDVIGVYYAIKNRGFEIKDKKVLLLGAGGAGNACAVMAADRGCKKLYIANRTVEKAQKLSQTVADNYACAVNAMSLEDIYDIDSVDIVINSTVMGFGKNIGISPVKDKSFFRNKNVELVFDAIYAPWETQLLKEAAEMGVSVLNGFDMLVYQAVAAEEIWFEESYDKELQEKLCSDLKKYYRENC